MTKRWLVVLIIAVGAIAAGACFSAPEVTDAPVVSPEGSASTNAFHVTAVDYRYNADIESVRAGTVQFAFTNGGEQPHEMAVVPFSRGRYGLPIAEIEPLPPGESRVLTVVLAPGQYQVVCLLITTVLGEPESHLSLGMNKAFKVKS